MARNDADKAAAATAYERAEKALRRRRNAAALAAAEDAWEALPNASTALLKAVVLGTMGRHREAFETYLLASDLSPTAQELELIRAGLEQHGKATIPQLGWLVIVVDPAEAQVTVDSITFDAPRTVGLSTGRHNLLVRAEGHEPTRSGLTINAGVGQTLEFRLTRKQAANPSVGARPDPDPQPIHAAPTPPNSTRTTAGWALVGTAGALLATGIGMHVWSFDRAADTERYAVPSAALTEDERRSLHRSAEREMNTGAAVAGVAYGLAGATLVTGVVLLVLKDEPPAADQPVVAPVAGGHGAGAVVTVPF